jgi:hypothetical protein
MISCVSHRVSPTACPWCSAGLNGATGIETISRPKVGDFSVCIVCGGLIEFGIGLVLLRGSDTALASEPAEIQLQIREAQLAIALIHAPKRPH